MEYEPKWLTKGDLTFITSMYAESGKINKEKIMEKLRKSPEGFITIV